MVFHPDPATVAVRVCDGLSLVCDPVLVLDVDVDEELLTLLVAAVAVLLTAEVEVGDAGVVAGVALAVLETAAAGLAAVVPAAELLEVVATVAVVVDLDAALFVWLAAAGTWAVVAALLALTLFAEAVATGALLVVSEGVALAATVEVLALVWGVTLVAVADGVLIIEPETDPLTVWAFAETTGLAALTEFVALVLAACDDVSSSPQPDNVARAAQMQPMINVKRIDGVSV